MTFKTKQSPPQGKFGFTPGSLNKYEDNYRQSGLKTATFKGENSNTTLFLSSIKFFAVILSVLFMGSTKVPTSFTATGQGRKRGVLNVHVLW